MRHVSARLAIAVLGVGFLLSVIVPAAAQPGSKAEDGYLCNDSHFHLTNYIQEGTEIHDFLIVMGDKVGLVAPSGITRYPDRFLLGTDEVAPTDPAKHLKVHHMDEPLLAQRTPEVKAKLLKGNYERLFDAARQRVRAWDKANVGKPQRAPPPTPIRR
jgi:hypothetical protein